MCVGEDGNILHHDYKGYTMTHKTVHQTLRMFTANKSQHLGGKEKVNMLTSGCSLVAEVAHFWSTPTRD